jgi:hypothetical protein
MTRPGSGGSTLSRAKLLGSMTTMKLSCRSAGVARCSNMLTVEELLNRITASERSLASRKTGERDANKLCEHAIHGLTAFDYRQHDR